MDLDSLMRGLGPIQDTMKKAEGERASAQFEGKAGGRELGIIPQMPASQIHKHVLQSRMASDESRQLAPTLL